MRSRRRSRSKAAARCDAAFSLGASLSSNRPTLLTMAFIPPAPGLPDSAGCNRKAGDEPLKFFITDRAPGAIELNDLG
jgi:hypothetical protein